MLIKCPRCGFSQPKDQYCASCGVNMETYVPRKTSMLQKLLSSTLLQVVVVVALTLGVSYYVLRAHNSPNPQSSRRKNSPTTSTSNMASQSQQHNGVTDTPDSSGQPTVSVEIQDERQKETLAGANQNANQTKPIAANLNRAALPALAANGATTAAAVAAQTSSATIKLSYYEVSRAILSYWIQSGGVSRDDESAINAGSINQDLFQKQILYSALKTETTKVSLNVKTNFQSGVTKDNNFIGLNTEIALNTISDEQIIGSINLGKNTAQGPEYNRATLALRAGKVFFLHWKNEMNGLQNEPGIIEVPPFQILRSKQFLDQKTELVLIIEVIR